MTDEEEKLVDSYHKQQRRKYIRMSIMGFVVGILIGNLLGIFLLWSMM